MKKRGGKYRKSVKTFLNNAPVAHIAADINF
jgi:hypothetical protein